jgi:hypothetical protein
MNLRQKNAEPQKKEQKTYTQQFSSDCDKEPKIKGCQEAPDGFLYEIYEKSKKPLPPYARSPKLPCCENLFKQALFVVALENKKSSSHLCASRGGNHFMW